MDLRLLPIQSATKADIKKIRGLLEALRKEEASVVDFCSHYSDKIISLIEETLEELDGNEWSRRSELGLLLFGCKESLMWGPDSKQFVDVAVSQFEALINDLYSDNAKRWNESDLNLAKTGAAFAERITSIMVSAGLDAPSILLKVNVSYSIVSARLNSVTYQSQVSELAASISSIQLDLVDQLGILAEQQLKLIRQQTEMMHRFEDQSRQMEGINRLINRFSIAAAIAAILALILQALDVFHVIP